ncbi:LamG-like jellyroll fold domain-containing protein [Kutzneria chonburiensis]|uniref:LamG-like jellyroll fold domain-containing protein n=1 Tax=Kutzneria chonburiensis TaxID=1483604 RepID=A0ABV6MIZ7_9PSEU|nr:DNA/RNA non-specific endonuclease [Kutzneria chonburiensis]
MARVRSRRAVLVWIAVVLVAVMTLPMLATQGLTFTWWPVAGTMPAGASLTAPEQQSGKPGQAGDARSLTAPARNPERPPGAVPDKQPPLPASNSAKSAQHVKPKVSQHSTAPASDPKAVERPQARTATTETFDNPDGSHSLRIYDAPVNVRAADGSWQHIDPTLVPAGDRLRPTAARTELSLATRADDPALVRLVFDDRHVLAYGLVGAARSKARTQDATATYPAAFPGVDLALAASDAGVREDLLLTTAQAPTNYTYSLALTGLTPQLDAFGAVQLLDGTKVVATIPAGTATDAKQATGAVKYTLTKAGSGWTLGLSLDATWLHDPARAFPVDVDPTTTQPSAEEDDTYVQSNDGRDHSTSPKLETGYLNGGITRSYLRFDPARDQLANKYVLAASLNLDASYSTTCSPRAVNLFEVSGGWSRNQAWPGAPVGRTLATSSFAHGGPSCGPDWAVFQLDPDVMTAWTHGTALTNGFGLRAADESDRNGMNFESSNGPNQQDWPYLTVRYSDEGAAFQATDVLQPVNNKQGSVTAVITNQGSTTWTASNGWDFGYIIQPGNYVSNGTAMPHDVAPGQSVTLTIPLYALSPGRYQVFLTMWTPSKQDFFVAYTVPYGVFDLDVTNVPPSVNFEQPATPATVATLTPTLYAEATDTDQWPNKGLTYKFRLCADQALTQNCVESPWGGPTWSPPAGTLSWSKNYYWGVKANDTVDPSPDWVKLQLRPSVPQPEITSHLAGTPDTVHGPGLDPETGDYSLVDTDTSVATAGPDLTVGRTYNSLDPRRDSAFGIGWASRVDMKLARDDDGSGNLVLTYPTGRQLRFGLNPDGSYGSPAGDSTVLVHNTGGGLAYHTLRDATGGQWQFDAAQHLVTIIDPAGLTESLTYDGNDHVSTITNTTSGRTLTLTWTGNHVTGVATQAPKIGGTPLIWTYKYDGDQLTNACAPGNACTTYTYQAGSHYRSSVADDAPAAYWRLDEHDNTSFASSVAWHQGGENAAGHGVITGVPGAIAGTGDTAATFDGASSYVTLPDKLATTSMSMAAELWFKTTGSGVLMSLQNQAFPAGTPTSATPVLYVGTDGVLYGGFPMRDQSGPRQIVTTQAVNDGKWHHAVLSSAINTQTLYLDGQQAGSPITGLIDAKAQTTAVLGAGRGQGWPATNNGNFYFQGDIDEAAFYQHSLGALAAAEHYAAAQAGVELTGVTLPQDATRVYAKLTYDDINDRVASLVDHSGLKWTLDPPKITSTQKTDQNNNPYWGDVVRTSVLHGPQTYGDWTYTYDVVNGGRPMTTSHNGHGTSLEYNTSGFLSAKVDENGTRTEQTTDERGNVLSRKTCRAANSCDTSYYTYVTPANPLDPKGNKLASSSDARSAGATDTTYRTTYDYDAVGRPTVTTKPVPVGQTTHPTTVNVYSDGTQPTADHIGTVPAGLLLSTTGPRGEITSYRYNHNGDLAEQISPSKLHTQRTVDDIGRTVTNSTLNDGGAVFATTTYTYDARSQIATTTGQAVKNPVTGVTHTPVTTYGYDGDGNVTSSTVGDTVATDQGGDAPRITSYVYDAHDRLQQKTYPDGGVEKVGYSADNLSVTTTDVRGANWTRISDELGHELSTVVSGAGVDPQNPNATSLTTETKGYDPGGRLTVSTDAMGRTTTYGYWGDNLLATVTAKNYDGARDLVLEQRTYDPAGNLTQDVTAGGVTATTAYDAAGYISSTTLDPAALKRTTTYTRDLDGNALTASKTGAADPSRTEFTAYTYDNGNQVVREDDKLDANTMLSTSTIRDERELPMQSIDRRQLTTNYTYDGNGLLVGTTTPAADVWQAGKLTSNVRGVTTLGRNTFGEVTQSRDASGGVTTTARDGMGRATAAILPNYTPPGSSTPITATTVTEYDHAGNAVKVTDPLKRVTVNTYNPYNKLLTSTLPSVGDTPSVVTNAYDRDGEVTSTTDPGGDRTQFTYDNLGHRRTSTAVDDSSGQTLYYTTTTGYDDAGNPVTVTTPQNNTTTTAFDAAHLPTRVTDPTNRSTATSYDIAGRKATVTDPTGLLTATSYDLVGRPTRITQSSNGTELRHTTTGYDANGNVAAVTTAENRLTTYGYDALNRVAQQTEKVDDTHAITTTTGYDALGNKSHYVDGDGHATEYTYNPWGLPESTIDPATAAYPSLADRTRTTVYDAAGQTATMSEPGGVVRTNTYDAQGRLTRQTGTGAEASTADRKIGYDLAGRITTVGGPAGDTTYTYDDRGNLLTYTGPVTSGTYTYNGDGTTATRTDAAGTATFGYDNADRLASVTDPVTGRTMDYGYNSGGQLASITDRAVARTTSRTIGYDPLGRQTSDLLRQSPDGAVWTTRLGETYGYDLDDNLTSRSDLTVGRSANNGYGYDGAGRLTSWSDPTGKNTVYGWDNAGNRTSVGGQAYTYDERNELLSGNGNTYSYTARGTLKSTNANAATFDAFDRQITSGAMQYSYDGLDRVAVRNGTAFGYDGLTNNEVSDGSRVVSRLPDGTPLSDKAIGATGGKTLFADQHGDIVGRYLGGSTDGLRGYDPFGAVTSSSGDTSALGYQGGWTDSGTGQVDMAARWYSPASGQFTSRDSVNVPPNPSWAGNRFGYGNADPLDGKDPSGHCLEDLCIGEAALAVLAYGAMVSAAEWVYQHPLHITMPWDIPRDVPGTYDGPVSVPRDIAIENDDDLTCLGKCFPGPVTVDPSCKVNCKPDNPCRVNCKPPKKPDPPKPPRDIVNLLLKLARMLIGQTLLDPRDGTDRADPDPNHVTDPSSTDWQNGTSTTTVPTDEQLREDEAGAAQGFTAGDGRPKWWPGDEDDRDDCQSDQYYGPLDPSGRATGASAHLCPGEVSAPDRRDWGGYNPPGWPTPNYQDPNVAYQRYMYDRTHLLGRNFGGTQNPDNVVTAYWRVNQRSMYDFETRVSASLAAGDEVYYQIVPIYRPGQTRPVAISMLEETKRGDCNDVIIRNDYAGSTLSGGLCP